MSRRSSTFNILLAAIAVLLICQGSSNAQIIARAVSPDGDLNLNGITFTGLEVAGDSDYLIPGDQFGIRQQFVQPDSVDCTLPEGCGGIPFAQLDETLAASDGTPAIGIIDAGPLGPDGDDGDQDPFFGVTDTANGVGSNENTATFEFDISGASGDVKISIDIAAMGDFEDGVFSTDPDGANDFFEFAFSVDGGSFADIFKTVIDAEDSNPPPQPTKTYTLADGSMSTLNDPILIDTNMDGAVDAGDVELSNVFQTFTASLGSGNSLQLRFTAQTNGGAEAFAFRNVIVEEDTGGVAGDYDGDGFVTAADYTVYQDTFGSTTDLRADGNGNMVVDPGDLTFWQNAFVGAGAGSALGGSAVPEPSSLILLSLVSLGLAAVRRRAR